MGFCLRWLGILLGAVSLFSLAQRLYDFATAPVIGDLLPYYRASIHPLVSVFSEALERASQAIGFASPLLSADFIIIYFALGFILLVLYVSDDLEWRRSGEERITLRVAAWPLCDCLFVACNPSRRGLFHLRCEPEHLEHLGVGNRQNACVGRVPVGGQFLLFDIAVGLRSRSRHTSFQPAFRLPVVAPPDNLPQNLREGGFDQMSRLRRGARAWNPILPDMRGVAGFSFRPVIAGLFHLALCAAGAVLHPQTLCLHRRGALRASGAAVVRRAGFGFTAACWDDDATGAGINFHICLDFSVPPAPRYARSRNTLFLFWIK